jgi:hypothetical protein
VAVGLTGFFRWAFPFSSCEAAEDEFSGSPNNSQGPALLIALFVEVLSLPAMSISVKNPLKSSFRILVPYKFHYHHPMGRGPKSLRVSEIFFRINNELNARLR